MTERQLWQLRVVRAKALLAGLKARYAKKCGKARKQTVADIRAVVAEIEWLRHRRDAFPACRQGEWDGAFAIRWEERVKSAAEERARKAAARAERERKRYQTDEERRAAQSAIGRRYRERKALAAGKPMPRHYRKYATDAERYQAILASNRESARRRKEREARAKELLEPFDLMKVAKQPAYTLSGGERRKLEIARALTRNPFVLMLDEPFAGVDPLSVNEIQDIVRSLAARGLGIIITDHNVRETLSVVNRAYLVYDGRLLKEGTSAELVSDSEVREKYLGENFRM